MLETIIASTAAFTGTNLDDLFLNLLFFPQADSPRSVRSVVAGKYLGIGVLVLLSLLGAGGAQLLPQKALALLGLIPLALGLRAWFPRNDSNEGPPVSALSVWSVAGVTLANGGDNLGVYIPLFAGYPAPQLAVVLLVFALLTAVWCVMGRRLADLPRLREFLLRHRAEIVPVVLTALGLYILAKGLFLT